VMQFVWFLGRFHVLIVHLPLGILTLAVALEVLVRFKPFKFLEGAVGPTWVAGALSAVATVALGLMHATEASFQDMPAVDAHRLAGASLCVATCIVAVLRLRMHPVANWPDWAGPRKMVQPLYKAIQPIFARGALLDRAYARLWLVPVLVVTALMFVTGHLGGNLTHGETYLVEYAPNPIRLALGLPATAGPRAKPKDLASADLFLDVVNPALQQRCSTCHNDSKKSGGLSMASYDALLKGGNKGPVITPNSAATSDLYHRVSLTPDSGDFMPKDGKTPLTRNEVTAIGFWIAQGAPKSGLVGTMKLTADASQALQAVIGAGGAAGGDEQADNGGGVSTEAPLPTVPVADAALVNKVVGEGFILRKVDKASNLLDADYVSAKPVTTSAIQDLARLAPQLLRLNLRHAGVTDDMVKTISGFPNLRHLRLEANPGVTDAAARDIATAKTLTYLNLVNTKVTDTGFGQVSALPKLQRFYFWGTPITPAAVDKVKASRKDLVLYAGLTAKDVPIETKTMTPAN
jgi:Planctomycete cytochrome C